MNIIEAMMARRSVREYTDGQIAHEVIRQIIDCGNCAPISGQVHSTVISNKSTLNEMDLAAKEFIEKSDNDFLKERIAASGYRLDYNAPYVIVVSSTERPYQEANGACAVTNMCNAAVEYGLGSCFLAGIIFAFKELPDLKEKLGIPDKFIPQFAVCLGHCAKQYSNKIVPRCKNYNYV